MRNNVWKKISNLDQPIFCGHDLVNSGMRIVHENTNFCGSETDCGEKWKKKKNVCGYQTKKCQGDQTNTKKGSTGFSFTRETYGVHSHMAIAHLSCSIVNSHWLLLSWASIRLKHSPSYPLLRHVLAKKKQRFQKFWKWKIHHDGHLSCKVWLNVQRLQLCQ